MGNNKSLLKPTYEDISSSISDALALRHHTPLIPEAKSICDTLQDSWETIHNRRDATSWEYGLCFAVSNGNIIQLSKLQENNPNIMSVKDRFGYSLLHLSVWYGQTEMTEYLLGYLDVNVKSFDDWTPLHSACRKGICQMTELLLHRGAQLNSQSACGWTPLHYATWTDHNEVVKLLLDKGADTNIVADNGWTSLHYASWQGSGHAVKELLTHGADANVRETTFGRTPLHYAIECKNMEIIAILLRADADVNLQDLRGISAFRFAYDNNLDITNLLLENVVDLEVTDHVSYGIVEKAMSLNVPDVLRCLIAKNDEDRAVDAKNTELTVEYLETILDNCIGVERKTIYINYCPLLPRNFKNIETLLPIFIGISKEHKFEHLLLHPTIRSYLLWKWGQVSKYFYTNLFLFLLACANLLMYQFLFYLKQIDVDVLGYFLYTILGLSCFILFIRELAQFYINWKLHLNDAENYFELALIVYMLIILCWYPKQMSYRIQLVAMGNVIIAVTLTLLMGHHPIASSAVHLLRTVTYKFITYFIVYLLIILAFAISFFQLNNDSDSHGNIVGKSDLVILRTIGMFIGELNLNEFFSGKYSFVVIILLLCFVLFVSVIILNLLNGLAISNILEKSELEISRFKSQLSYLHNLTSILNIVYRILLQTNIIYIFPKQFSKRFNKNIDNIFILRNYINHQEFHIFNNQSHLYSNKLHKLAHERLKHKRIRESHQNQISEPINQNVDISNKFEKLESKMEKMNEDNKKLLEQNIKLTIMIEEVLDAMQVKTKK